MFFKHISKKSRGLKNKQHKAFTLAEVLVTLAVIGVVAAFVIPGLIQSYQKHVTISKLKKALSVGNSALTMAAIKHCGTADLSCIFTNLTTAGDAIAAQYNVVKNCRNNTGQGCFAVFNINFDGSSEVNFDWDNDNDYYKFITADGMSIAISRHSTCASNYEVPNSNSPTSKTCGVFFIDLNGPNKGPNYDGKDVFRFFITSNKAPVLYPRGGWHDNKNGAGNEATGGDHYWKYNSANRCSPSGSKGGNFCTGRIIEKGWTIDYY